VPAPASATPWRSDTRRRGTRLASRHPEPRRIRAMAQKSWFITGASSGLGREWAIAALDRGDRVAAAARTYRRLEELGDEYGDRVLPIELDVTDRDAVLGAVDRARGEFGRLDVVVNNAGYGVNGVVEEVSEQEARDQMDTNFFGVLWVTQAALPILREQRGGHIIQVSSVGGLTAFPNLGLYCASKWALEGMSQALAQEVADFGIKVTIIEPTGYRTNGDSAARHATPIEAYEPQRERVRQIREQMEGGEGDPVATRAAILEIVDADAPPLRVFFGANSMLVVTAEYESRLATWRLWEPLSLAAHGSPSG
jgi:NAD(P)-dependent dehydrogenase (short-subunit alcohol dehydrogenase family)